MGYAFDDHWHSCWSVVTLFVTLLFNIFSRSCLALGTGGKRLRKKRKDELDQDVIFSSLGCFAIQSLLYRQVTNQLVDAGKLQLNASIVDVSLANTSQWYVNAFVSLI